MHWAYEIAEKLIRKFPEKEVYTCASGISPSGHVHIGNFREVITTYFVVKALQSYGKRTRFIFSWDDYDRLRKIPADVDSGLAQYIGMPYADVPSPEAGKSYASYFETEFEETLQQFHIYPEYINQNREYRSGRYNELIKIALLKRKEIYDILQRFKTSKPIQEEREAFFPISCYCHKCNKDFTSILSFDEEWGKIYYSCECGFHGSQSLKEQHAMKLNWKVDWAMRWSLEDVVFEPGGRDHSSATGSYNVSKEIARDIFQFEAPEYTAYEFIGIKGTYEKMSSSSGNTITPRELLQVYTPEVILFMFAKYHPSNAFHFSFDEDVLRHFSEYERYCKSYSKITNETIVKSMELAGWERSGRLPGFNHLAGIFPLIGYNNELLLKLLEQADEKYSFKQLIMISRRVSYWIKKWQPERDIKVTSEKNLLYYQHLPLEQKEYISQFVYVLKEGTVMTENELMSRLYNICHHEDKKRMKASQRDLFKSIYYLVLNRSSGPRIPLLIAAIGKERLIDLLSFDTCL